MRWLLVLALVGCGAPAPAPATATAPPAKTASAPAWSVGERARVDLDAPFTSAVRADNQRPLDKTAIPWAHYLNAVHARLHPVFTDQYLASLGGLDRAEPLNNPALRVRVELTITPEGNLEGLGVVKSSGQTSFDLAALESFARIAPLPPAEPVLRSKDGRAHVQWELGRDEEFGCAPIHAHPFNLGGASSSFVQ